MSAPAGGVRQALLRVAVVLATLGLAVRLVQIQVVQHERYRVQAEGQWRKENPVPADRGGLYDRNGRPLAVSTTSWRVGVSTARVADTAVLARRIAPRLELPAAEVARKLARGAGGHVVLAGNAVLGPAALDSLKALGPVNLEQIDRRAYPLGGVGASLIGFWRPDEKQGELATGIEAGLSAYLAGVPGQEWRLVSAKAEQRLGAIQRRAPVHGRDLLLTIDADLQAVCEEALAQAVERCHANGGAVLVFDPSCGDVLAAAAWPMPPEGERSFADLSGWNSFAFTRPFEPGSVFKVFTAASLLRHGAIDTGTVLDCTNGDLGGFTVRNSESHEYGPLSFMRGFALSSNIYFARAVANLRPLELYSDLREMGFGQMTALPYPGQPQGSLAPPERWSRRTQATIAFGQEVSATALQVGLAACAVANGGMLYAPRIVREVRDHEGSLLERCPPAPLRRVLSEPLAALLRLAMRRVVEEGTGRKAELEWIEVGGKTGTAQKALPGRGYVPGLYTASFLGFVPWDEPRLVVLAVLDEPDYAHHYAAQSAAPLFAEVVKGARQATGWLTGIGEPVVAAAGPAGGSTVPDVLYLSAAAARERLQMAGLACAGDERDGIVIEQVPGAGARCPAGAEVRLAVAAARTPREPPLCPDLAGLSERQVVGMAARLGLPVAVEGAGYVEAQEPPAGDPVGPQGIRVRMVAAWR